MKMTRLVIRSVPARARGRSSAPPEPGPDEPGARDRILDAADRALAGAGYRHMRIEDLAEAAGIAKGTVYLSFPSKQEIALACIDRMAGRVLARMVELAASKGPVEARLRRILVERVLMRFDYAREHSSSIDEILIAIRPGLLARRLEHFAAESQVVAGLLKEQTGAPARAAVETARAMIVATNALLPYSLSVREMGRRAEIAHRADRVARLVVAGALASAPSHPAGKPSARRRSS